MLINNIIDSGTLTLGGLIMPQYIILALIPLLTAFSSVFRKKYTDRTLDISSSMNIFILMNTVIALIFFAAMAGGRLIPNLPTLIYSVFYALLSILSNIFLMLALSRASLVNTSVFSGAGSITMPFIFGAVFLNESISVFKIIAVCLLLLIIILPLITQNSVKKTDLKGYLYCIAMFAISGGSAIFSKIYALDSSVLNNNILCFWTNVFMLPFVGILLLKQNGIGNFIDDFRRLSAKLYLFIILPVLLSNSVTLLTLFVMKNTDIIIYTIVTSSLSLIFTACFARIFFKDKITPTVAFNIIVSIAAIILNTL